jgi:hypothetical protein
MQPLMLVGASMSVQKAQWTLGNVWIRCCRRHRNDYGRELIACDRALTRSTKINSLDENYEIIFRPCRPYSDGDSSTGNDGSKTKSPHGETLLRRGATTP